MPDRDEPGTPFVPGDAGQEKLIKVRAKVVRHGRYVAFQMAAANMLRYVFAGILRLIAEPRPPPEGASTDPREFT